MKAAARISQLPNRLRSPAVARRREDWPDIYDRRRMSATCTGVHTPPRAVLIPRADRARATPRSDLTPLACICWMTGRTLAANLSAACRVARAARWRACASFGLPSRLPRALAACRASLVRWAIISRSCCATAARMWTVSLFACGLSTATNSTPESPLAWQ
jgi:hypothetical protein